MKFVKTLKLSTEDTKLIRKTLKENGLTVSTCKLIPGKWSVSVHTSDNRQARKLIDGLGYTLNKVWETEDDRIFQNDPMNFEKIETDPEPYKPETLNGITVRNLTGYGPKFTEISIRDARTITIEHGTAENWLNENPTAPVFLITNYN